MFSIFCEQNHSLNGWPLSARVIVICTWRFHLEISLSKIYLELSSTDCLPLFQFYAWSNHFFYSHHGTSFSILHTTIWIVRREILFLVNACWFFCYFFLTEMFRTDIYDIESKWIGWRSIFMILHLVWMA